MSGTPRASEAGAIETPAPVRTLERSGAGETSSANAAASSSRALAGGWTGPRFDRDEARTRGLRGAGVCAPDGGGERAVRGRRGPGSAERGRGRGRERGRAAVRRGRRHGTPGRGGGRRRGTPGRGRGRGAPGRGRGRRRGRGASWRGGCGSAWRERGTDRRGREPRRVFRGRRSAGGGVLLHLPVDPLRPAGWRRWIRDARDAGSGRAERPAVLHQWRGDDCSAHDGSRGAVFHQRHAGHGRADVRHARLRLLAAARRSPVPCVRRGRPPRAAVAPVEAGAAQAEAPAPVPTTETPVAAEPAYAPEPAYPEGTATAAPATPRVPASPTAVPAPTPATAPAPNCAVDAYGRCIPEAAPAPAPSPAPAARIAPSAIVLPMLSGIAIGALLVLLGTRIRPRAPSST